MSVSITGSEARGVLRTVSTEGAPVMKVEQVKLSAKVAVHDQVVTSGFSDGELRSIYPRSIPVGEVVSVGYDRADLDTNVQVKPYADFDRIYRLTGDDSSEEVA